MAKNNDCFRKARIIDDIRLKLFQLAESVEVAKKEDVIDELRKIRVTTRYSSDMDLSVDKRVKYYKKFGSIINDLKDEKYLEAYDQLISLRQDALKDMLNGYRGCKAREEKIIFYT